MSNFVPFKYFQPGQRVIEPLARHPKARETSQAFVAGSRGVNISIESTLSLV